MLIEDLRLQPWNERRRDIERAHHHGVVLSRPGGYILERQKLYHHMSIETMIGEKRC